MTTVSTATVQVATGSLRAALNSVRVHAEKNITSADGTVLHRLRLSFGKDELHIYATNAQTSAVSIVPILEDDRRERFAVDDGPYWADITPRQALRMVQHFTTARASVAEAQDLHEMLEIKVTPEMLSLRDVGGLWTGEAYQLPQLAFAQNYPDVGAAIGGALAGVQGKSAQAKPLVVDPELLALFDKAGKQYAAPVGYWGTGSATSRGFVVEVGDSFVGTVESRHNEDDWAKRRQSVHMKHLERFPGKALAAVGG